MPEITHRPLTTGEKEALLSLGTSRGLIATVNLSALHGLVNNQMVCVNDKGRAVLTALGEVAYAYLKDPAAMLQRPS